MSDLTTLAQKIAALAARDVVFDGDARVISAGGAPAPLAAILAEVDETILERELEFTTGAATISLIAAGGRLRGLAAAPETLPGARAALNQSLSREDPEALQAVFQVLSAFCTGADRIAVRALAPRPFGKGGEPGVSARRLAKEWQLSASPDNPAAETGTPFEQFLQEIDPLAIAMIHVHKGAPQARRGDVEALQTILDTQIEAFGRLQQAQRGKVDDPQLICMADALADGTSAALAMAGDDLALVAYDGAGLGALQGAWRRRIG